MRTSILPAILFLCACGLGGEKPAQGEPEWKGDRDAVLADYFRKMDRRVSGGFVDTPFGEAIMFLNTHLKLNVEITGEPSTAPLGMGFKDELFITALEQMCKACKADWTIAPLAGSVQLQIDTPEKIAEVEKKHPAFAEKVREHRFNKWRNSFDAVDAYFAKLERRVSCEFAETPVEEAIQFLNSLMKVNIELVGSRVVERQGVTLRLTDVPVWVVFDQVHTAAGLDWTIAPGDQMQMVCVQTGTPEKIAEVEKKWPKFAEKVRNFRRAPAAVDACLARLDKPASFELEDTPLSEALMFLLNGVGKINYVPAGEPKDVKISVKLKDKPLGVILEQMCKAGNCDWTVAPQRPGEWVYVIYGTPEQIAEIEKQSPNCGRKVQEWRKSHSEKK